MTTVVPQPAREQPPLCACGCGQRVKTRGSQYVRGCSLRGRPRGPGGRSLPVLPEQHCANCGKRFRPRQASQAVFCSYECFTKSRRKHRTPKRELGKFLRRKQLESGLNDKEFARSLGVGPQVPASLMTDHLPTDRTLAKLRAVYGDELPRTETATERRREWAAAKQAEFAKNGHPGQAQAAREKAGEKLRGRSKGPKVVKDEVTGKMLDSATAKMRATQRANGAAARAVAGLIRWAGTDTGKVTSACGLLVAWKHLDSMSADEIIADVARRTGVHQVAVRAILRPRLQALGKLSRAGAPRKMRRQEIIDTLMDAWPRTPSGRLKGEEQLWQQVSETLTKEEGAAAPAPHAARRWHYRNRRWRVTRTRPENE